jgi:ketosteroid isomerase-like protein
VIKRGLPTVVALVAIAWSAAAQSRTELGPVETVQKFVRANELADLESIMATFDEGATHFAPAQPLRASGKPAIREAFAQVFKQRRGPIIIMPTDVAVQSFGDVAIVTAHLGALPALPVAEPTTFGRRTFVLRRTANEWRIVHLHASNFLLTPSKP